MITLLTFLFQLLEMYNSEEVYTFEENRQTQSQNPSADQQRNGRLNNSRPKNALFSGQKQNGISGTYARIVPKRPLHDMQRLYAENMQLRERIKFLEDDCTKIKTRVSMAERQKQQLITQLCNAEFGNNVLRDRRPSQKGLNKTQQKPIKSVALDQNRKILHSYKDEISKLKVQNGRLKKTVKYTQIQELQTQNQLLHEEMARMKRYTQDVIENTQYDEYEKQIEMLNKQLISEKDSKKNLLSQMKKKDDEMQDLKNKMKIIANRKSQLEKKYNREMTSIKSELHRAKEKQKEYFVSNQQRKQSSKPKIIEKVAECKKCSNLKENLDDQRLKNKELNTKLSDRQNQINQLHKKIKELETKKSKVLQPQSPNKDNKVQKSNDNDNKKSENQEQKKDSHGNEKGKKSQPQIQKQKEKPKAKEQNHQIVQKQKQKQKQENYDQGSDDYDEDSEELENTKNFNVQQSEDKVDVFHVNMSNEKQAKQEQTKNKKTEQDKYEEQFDQSENKKAQDDSQEQVLFQKQEKTKPKKKKEAPKQKKQKEKEKEKEKEKDKQAEKGGSSKAEKILKQTIKYRLMAQRYSYTDFHRDIKQSGATEFNIQELIQMLTNEPFFLSEQHLKLVLYSLFQKDELDQTDTTTTNSFLKKMKSFIGDFEIKDEAEEQLLLKSIQAKLAKKKVLVKMKQQSINDAQISKKGFVKVLKQVVGLNEAQIEQCLAEASVLSVDIAHINYPEFLQKLGYS